MSADVVVIGRLIKDVQTVRTNNGTVVHDIIVASPRGFGSKTVVDYYDCMAFAPKLDEQVPYLVKNQMVKVTGHLQTKQKNGITMFNVIIDNLEMLWGRGKEEKCFSSLRYMADTESFKNSIDNNFIGEYD